jgi:hypothetical protein
LLNIKEDMAISIKIASHARGKDVIHRRNMLREDIEVGCIL